ncbi:MAG: DegV family protein [Hungatella sp.]|nr:DegV family protein [Hungatella sp.]
MSYKIIGDSCLDLTDKMKNDSHFQMIPLTLQVDDVQVIDDETFDQKRFLELVKNSPNCPKTACPSPETFKQAYGCDADDIYVITLSSKLSGTYNSALIGKQMYEEEYGRKNIAIIDSWSASAGELRQALFIEELCKAGVPFEEVVKQVEDFKTNRMQTFFVLETLDALRKNGRLTGLQAFFATTLNIKPVMGAEQGTIIKLDQARGINKALSRMCSIAVKSVPDPENRIPVVAHCNNPERAQLMKEELLKLVPFKKVVITKTAGVATVYASDGGIVLAL